MVTASLRSPSSWWPRRSPGSQTDLACCAGRNFSAGPGQGLDMCHKGALVFQQYGTGWIFVPKRFVLKKKIRNFGNSDRSFWKTPVILLAFQNRDLGHNVGFCLTMRTIPSIVTCKFSLLRCTLQLWTRTQQHLQPQNIGPAHPLLPTCAVVECTPNFPTPRSF